MPEFAAPELLSVAVGGAVGAWLRWRISTTAAAYADRYIRAPFPAGTLFCNTAGSLILGLLTGTALAYPEHIDCTMPFIPYIVPCIKKGLCGALTTFSTFSAELFQLFRTGHTVTGFVYATASLIACISAAVLGIMIAAPSL